MWWKELGEGLLDLADLCPLPDVVEDRLLAGLDSETLEMIVGTFKGLAERKMALEKKLEWDAKNLNVTNCPDANRFTRRSYRKGWTI